MMRLTVALDLWVRDAQADGAINSTHTILAYRYAVLALAEDTGDAHLERVTREQVKETLGRWPNPRTRRARHSALTSFFDWCVYERHLKSSPAREVKPATYKARAPRRITHSEVIALLDAAESNRRDRWAVNLLLYTGCRNAELRALKCRDLHREGWVRLWGKGGRERWVPVVPELQPVVNEILTLVEPEGFVLPGQRSADPPFHTRQYDSTLMLSSSALRNQIVRLGERAGVAVHVHPHLLRHAHAEAVVRFAGARVGQAVLGHSSIETTVGTYTGGVSLDELAASMTGFGFRSQSLPVKEQR